MSKIYILYITLVGKKSLDIYPSQYTVQHSSPQLVFSMTFSTYPLLTKTPLSFSFHLYFYFTCFRCLLLYCLFCFTIFCFRARCDHIATLDTIDLHSPSFTGHAEHRSLRSNNSKKKQPVDSRTSSSNSDKASPLSAAVTSETSHPLRDYLFNQLTVVPQSAQAAVFGHAGTDSGGDTTGTVTIGKTKHHHKHKDEGFAQRCAYSFSSGGDAQHLSIVDGTASRLGVTAHRCTSRDSFRFKLVEVLSRLHDDGVLINMRDNNTAYAVSDVHLTDHTQHAVHKCT